MNQPVVRRKKKLTVFTPVKPIPRPTQFLQVVGTFPELEINHETWLSGPIELYYGEHRHDGGGYGFQHIWKDHFKAINDEAAALSKVLVFLQNILVPGAPIYYEHALGRLGQRAVVLKAQNGMVVLERRIKAGADTYSVVTAYLRRDPTGYKVGAL